MVNWRKYLKKDNIVFKIVTRVISILGFIALLYWLNFKGMVGMMLGMTAMAYLILSKNPLIMWIVEKTRSTEYIDELERI